MEEAKKTGLLGKLALVMRDVSNIPKNGWNAHFKYKSVLDTDVVKAVHDSFVTHGVVMISSMTSSQRDANNTVCQFIFTLYDAESGESISAPWEGEAYDQQDKGINKAATAAVKYFLLKLFLISTGDLGEDADAGPKTLAGESALVEQRGTQKTPINEPELFVITFGKKHPGETLGEIVKKDRSFLDYLVKEAREPDVAAAALAVLEKFKPETEPETEPESAKHWIMEKGENAKYYAKLKELGLNMKQGKEILVGVKGDMRKYPGSLEDAIAALGRKDDVV